MILPTKHTNLAESILGLSGFLLSLLKKEPYSVDELWQQMRERGDATTALYKSHSYDNVIMAIDLLYMMGVVTLSMNGKITIV